MALIEFVGATNKINPIIYYSIGYLAKLINGDVEETKKYYVKAMLLSGKYCFPSRKEEMTILLDALNENCKDNKALYYLGNLYYSKEHYEKALLCWEKALEIEPNNYILKRNLAIGYYNKDNWNKKSKVLLKEACALKQHDIQLAYELNYLLDKQNIDLAERQESIDRQEKIVTQRDDLILQKIKLENDKGHWEEALNLLSQHTFTPCEGGEHTIIEQYAFAHHAIGRKALADKDYLKALNHFKTAQMFPKNLGAAVWHEVMKVPHMYYEAICNEKMGKTEVAEHLYEAIIDIPFTYFTKMYLPSFEYYKILSYEAFGNSDERDALLESLINECSSNIAKKDYGFFKATPFFVSYLEKPENARKVHYLYLLALCSIAKKDNNEARKTLEELLELSKYHQAANLEYKIINGWE